MCCAAASEMELRRRNGNCEATDAANAKNAPAISAEDLSDQHQKQHPSVTHDNIAAAEPLRSEDAADAVIGAAVRGGSLLMLLALIQVSTRLVLDAWPAAGSRGQSSAAACGAIEKPTACVCENCHR